jgi:hypothetical protein
MTDLIIKKQRIGHRLDFGLRRHLVSSCADPIGVVDHDVETASRVERAL